VGGSIMGGSFFLHMFSPIGFNRWVVLISNIGSRATLNSFTGNSSLSANNLWVIYLFIYSWIEGSRNGYWHRNRFSMQKLVMNWICLFFLGMAKPCAAHSDLFVLWRTPISQSFNFFL
jgi:hypothetical protein